MEFEYDPEKSQANEVRHGIDFEQAKGLWSDDDRLVIPARSESEPRWAMLAQHGAKVWAAFGKPGAPHIGKAGAPQRNGDV